MDRFLAWIVPVSGDGAPEPPITRPPWWPGSPTHPIPPGIWPTPPGQTPPWWPGSPTHPIPPGIWPAPPGVGAPGFPSHPIYYPGFPGTPTHPIPPSIWPNPPAGGIVIPPPHVEHPIPPSVWPTPPGPPPGGDTGSPSHPINLPPEEAAGDTPGFWALAFFPDQCVWKWVWVPVEVPAASR
jgi:hypothetical protein